jgi:hypothetical protein
MNTIGFVAGFYVAGEEPRTVQDTSTSMNVIIVHYMMLILSVCFVGAMNAELIAFSTSFLY